MQISKVVLFLSFSLLSGQALAATASNPSAGCVPFTEAMNNVLNNPSSIVANLPTANNSAQIKDYFYKVCTISFGLTDTNCLINDPPIKIRDLPTYKNVQPLTTYKSGCGRYKSVSRSQTTFR